MLKMVCLMFVHTPAGYLATLLIAYGSSRNNWVEFYAHVTTEEKNQTVSFHIGLLTSEACLPRLEEYDKHCQNGTLREILNDLEGKGEIPQNDLVERAKFKYRFPLLVIIFPVWILCFVNSFSRFVLPLERRTSVRLAMIVVNVLTVSCCLTVFELGIQQNRDTSAEMDKFNNVSKDIIVEMRAPVQLIVLGVGVFLESLLSIVPLKYLTYLLKGDAQNRDSPPAPKPPPALKCIPKSWVTNEEMKHSSATKIPEPLPYDTIKTDTGFITQL